MRILMWFTIGFALCCSVAAYDMMYPWLPPAALIALSLAIAVICITRKQGFLRPMLLLLTGCLAGIAWFAGYYLVWLHPIKALDEQELPLAMTACDYSYETPCGIGLEGQTVIDGKSYQVRAYMNQETVLQPGDRVSGTFRLRLTIPDIREDTTYYQGNGIFLFAYPKGEVTISHADQIPRQYFPAVLRQKLLTVLDTVFPKEEASFAKALLLGFTGELDYATETALKISGIRHIVSVSGLHISVLYGLLCVLSGRKRILTVFLGLPVLLLFAAAAGFTPSVTRACIMVCLMMLSQLFNREYDPATALSFAVLVMLAVNPMSVTSVSLQLSVGCVAGILLFNSSINRWLKNRCPKKKGIAATCWGMVCGSISVTVSSMTLVTPLAAYYFGAVSLVSVLTNLLTLWVVNLIFNGLIFLCLIYTFFPAAAGIPAAILVWPIRYVVLAARGLASLPLAAVYTKSIYIVLWLVFVYILLAVFLWMKEKRPGVLICCGILGLCIALMASWAEPLIHGTGITMLDVGQGQSILLQSEGKTILVDCGGDNDAKTADATAETLLSQGISRLDGIIVTHYDRDHAGALANLLTRIDTDFLFLPDTQNNFEIPETTGEILYVWEDLELTFGNAALQIYGPVYSGMDNENSLCVLFDTEKCDILITGDRSAFGERMLLRRRPLPDVDILVAGHHGAADSTSEELLKAVTPETVLISVAQDNIYGHPSPALLHRLEAFGCSVFRTDFNGTITIRR